MTALTTHSSFVSNHRHKSCSSARPGTISQSPCTALTAGICLPLELYNGTFSGRWKFPPSPEFIASKTFHKKIIPGNHKKVMPVKLEAISQTPQRVLIVTSLGLCSSLRPLAMTGSRMNNQEYLIWRKIELGNMDALKFRWLFLPDFVIYFFVWERASWLLWLGIWLSSNNVCHNALEKYIFSQNQFGL